nr:MULTISPECIES: hypothetical protein [unclassified Microcoleus]
MQKTNLSWTDLKASNPQHARLGLTALTGIRLPWGVYVINHKKARKEHNES